MKILILSDLHTEFVGQFWALPERLPDFDVCVLAGDIAGTPRKGVEWALAEPALSGKPVVYVPGNHEFYGREIESALRDGKEAAAGTNVRLLDRDMAVIECGVTVGSAAKCDATVGSAGTKPVRFVGAILWTDYRLQGSQAWAMAAAARGLNDHFRIERRGPRGSLHFTPDDALERHYADKWFIDEALALPFEGDTVVVTHHAPHPGSLAERFEHDGLSSCFVSDLSDLIDLRRPALWVHGHTHDCFDYRAGETRIVCNPKGYGPMRPGQALDNPLFDTARIIEI